MAPPPERWQRREPWFNAGVRRAGGPAVGLRIPAEVMAHTMMTTSIRRSRLQPGLCRDCCSAWPAAGLRADQPGAAGCAREWHYRVVPGDTLIGIAAAYLIDPAGWRRLQQHNRIEDPRRLQPGQVRADPVRLAAARAGGGRGGLRPGRRERAAAGSATAEPVRPAPSVRPADLLRTGPQASATLRFADGSRLLISPRQRGAGRATAGLRPQRHRRSPGCGCSAAGSTRRCSRRAAARRRSRSGRRRSTSACAAPNSAPASSTAMPAGRSSRCSRGGWRRRRRTAAVAGTVSVDAGYGTHALPQQPVAPPRPLLPAPAVLPTATSAGNGLRRCVLNWQPVEGAVGYRAQIFADAQASSAAARCDADRGRRRSWPIEPSLPTAAICCGCGRSTPPAWKGANATCRSRWRCSRPRRDPNCRATVR